jgi:hypothetical protein
MRTLVLSRRRMNWKFDFSPETSDIVAVDERCYCWRREYNQESFAVRWIFEVCAACQARANRAKPSLGGRSFSRVRTELHFETPFSEQ